MERLKMSWIILVVYGFIILISPGLTGCHLVRLNATSQFNHGLNCYEKGQYDNANCLFITGQSRSALPPG